MKSISKIGFFAAALVLMGQGCLGGGGAPGSDGGVFKTSNGGDDWAQVTVIPGASGVGTIAGTDVRTIEMDPQDKSVLYAGTLENGFLFTEDAAGTWRQPRHDALRDGPINAVEVDPKHVCTMYVAKQQRLYKTEDCGRHFDSEAYVETRSGVFVRRISVDWFNENVVWIGLSNGDVFKSENKARTWTKVYNGRNAVTDILIHNVDSRNVLVATEGNGFFKTADGGANWLQVEDEDGLATLRNVNRVYSTAQTNSSDTVIAATAYGIIRSHDFGDTWQAVDLLTAPGQVAITAMGIAPDNADRMYYAAANTFYSSPDGGNTWTTFRVPTSRVVSDLVVDPVDPSVVYVGVVTPEE